MKFITIFSVVALAISANGFYFADEEMTDKAMFLRIIECAQQAVLNGLPEIGLPVHNPLKIRRNISYPLTLAGYTLELDLESLYIEGIPFWEVRQFDDKTEVVGNPIFDYAIYWPRMAFGADWKIALTEASTNDTKYKDEGTIYIELDHLTFSGEFNFTKPGDDDVVAGFNDFEIHFYTEDSTIKVEGLGLISTLINTMGGPVVKQAVNMDLISPAFSSGLLKRFNEKWVQKPERIEALITHCT